MATINNNINPRDELNTFAIINGNLNGKMMNKINNTRTPISRGGNDFNDFNCSKTFILYNIINDFIFIFTRDIREIPKN